LNHPDLPKITELQGVQNFKPQFPVVASNQFLLNSKMVKKFQKFLINSLTQHRKFSGPFLLEIYRVCMKSMVIVFDHPVRNFSDRIFFFTPLKMGAQGG